MKADPELRKVVNSLVVAGWHLRDAARKLKLTKDPETFELERMLGQLRDLQLRIYKRSVGLD